LRIAWDFRACFLDHCHSSEPAEEPQHATESLLARQCQTASGVKALP
jgi:hypothetical protein